jgi:hypothetical protein
MSLVANASRMIARKGETMTLTRASEGTTISLKGRRTGGGLDDVGNADQQAFRVKIGTVELLASAWAVKVPTAGGSGAGDTITIGGRVRNILDVRPIRDGETVGIYDLEVAG